jgi:prevent-host-death family protein
VTTVVPVVVNLKESKARLSELVARAGRGEEIVVTVRGKPAARLLPVRAAGWDAEKQAQWLAELATLRGRGRAGNGRGPTTDEILSDQRAARG